MAVQPKRGQYLGRFAVDPSPTEPGQWWYNTTEEQWKWWDGLTTRTGKLYEGSATVTVNAGVTTQPMTIIIAGMTSILYVVEVRASLAPGDTFAGVVPMQVHYHDNIVGLTMWISANAAGITLTGDILAQGW